MNNPVNDTIHAQNMMGLYIVYVQIDDHEEPLEFIFDTGANLTVINKTTADRLGLEVTGDLNLGDSQGQRNRIPLTMIKTLRLGEGVYENVLAAVIQFPENSTVECIAKDGILGYHVIREMQWAIHPGDTILVGSTESLLSDRSYDEIEMKGWKAPLLQVNFKGIGYKNVLFDSGSTGGLDLEQEYLSKVSDSVPVVVEIDGTSQGVFGNNIDTVVTVRNTSIGIGSFDIQSDVDFSQTNSRKIGMRTMGLYHIIIDGQNEKLYLGEREIEYQRTRSFGMIPGISDSTLYVSSLEIDGQASENNIQFLQALESVNGYTAEDINAMECGYLNFILEAVRDKETMELVTKSGDKLTLTRGESKTKLLD
ncbi:MAG: retropepsin-like domain-containing protein [Oceanospirillaceae bacterium]|nr:retropepsin-like domain-containing protein [Oceanospirillaceae bacterium]